MTFGQGTDFGASPGELGSSLQDVQSTAAGFSGELAGATEAMRAMDAQAQRLSRSLGSGLRTALDRAVFGGAKFSDIFRGVALDIAGNAFNTALKPLTGGLVGALSGAMGFANGGAFSSGRVRAFARGGIVDAPTVFPMRGGTGLMGEAGPEAIMPLARGADGKLGVRGGGGVSVTVNISTPDAAGFQRSQSQVSAMIARAVARGQRNL